MDNIVASAVKKAINIFKSPRFKENGQNGSEQSYYYSGRPYRYPSFIKHGPRAVTGYIWNRIAMDVSSITIQHARLDESGRFIGPINSRFNRCLTIESNIDQSAKAFIQDVVLSMFDEGCVAIVPVEIYKSKKKDSYDISSMRVGKIISWMPDKVKVNLYNEVTGQREDFVFPKKYVAIVENPLYSVMNEPNSTVARLLRKMNLLDMIDEQSSSGKLDLIIQLPYQVRGEGRRRQAEERRKDLENQLLNSKYGVAYSDGTEKIIQLNRPIENNLMSQIEFLRKTINEQLGISSEILNNSASQEEMLNYYSRIIEPIVAAIVDAMIRSFISPKSYSSGETIWYYRDPFKLITVDRIADIADKFTRNEILTSNEIRGKIGFMPSNDPRADQLLNKNLNHPDEGQNGEERTKQIENGDDM